MATDAENITALRAIYAQVIANIAAMEALGATSISVDGITVRLLDEYEKLARLAAIPGVAPLATFEVLG